MRRKILFIDDDPGVLKTAELLLRSEGYDFLQAKSPSEAYSVLATGPVDAILLDLNFSRAEMNGTEGLVCLREILLHDSNAVVIVVTGHSGLTVAVQALRAGAKNFIMKPWNNERLSEAIREAIDNQKNLTALAKHGQEAADIDTSIIIGECDAIIRAKQLIAKYAPLTANVLLMGESGTGKSLVAHALHRQSSRAHLKSIDASQLSLDDLTDISNATVVLEDIDGLDPYLSQPLLTWLQTLSRRNTRVITTTCISQTDLGIQKSLLYGLSTLEMLLPPLRERSNDIELLANHFANVFAMRQGMGVRRLSHDAIAALRGATWPDNLHTLRRVVERTIAGAQGPIVTAADLDFPTSHTASAVELGLNLDRTEKLLLEEALSRHNFNISKAAVALGLTRQALYRRIAKHGL